MADSLATLADPTDFGNKPGDGPLRPGGQPGTSERDANKPSTRSPRSDAQMQALARARDLWIGTDRLKRAGYLPRAAGEDQPNYANRLARSVFFNAFRRTVEGLAGLVFRKDIVLGDDVPAPIVEHWENIDLAGTHGDVFCRDLLQDDLQAGHAAILVEFPDTDGTQDAGSEMAGDIRPYWVPIRKEDIMSWRTTRVGGRTMLSQVVLREQTYEAKGDYGEQLMERYRVIALTGLPGTPVGWRVESINKAGEVTVDSAGFYRNQDEIPLAEIISSGKRSMFVSDPPLNDLALLNIAHYQMWSDYQWSIYKTCVPFIFGAGIDNAVDAAGNKIPLDIGVNTAVLQSNPDAKMGYVAHSGESLDSVKAALDDLKSDMGTLGLAMLAPQKRTAETAEAKRLDKSTSDSALSVTARGLESGIERALDFHARYLKLPDGGSVVVNKDFEGLLMDAPVMTAFATLVNAGFPPRPVLEALQQGGRIEADADLDALELEWMVGAVAVEVDAEEDAALEEAEA